MSRAISDDYGLRETLYYAMCCCVCVCCVCLFQAEDGIRDLVRSRGLGDVYKRQGEASPRGGGGARTGGSLRWGHASHPLVAPARGAPVSYTHLTLPTSDLV